MLSEMNKFILLLLLMLCLTKVCHSYLYSRTCNPNDRQKSRYPEEPDEYAKEFGVSVEQFFQMQDERLTEILPRDSPNYIKNPFKMCEALNAARVGLTVNAKEELADYFYKLMSKLVESTDGRYHSRAHRLRMISMLNAGCNYMYDPSSAIKNAQIFNLSMDYYLNFESTRLNKINTRTAAESIAAARKLCNIVYYTEAVASLKPKTHSTLSSEQLIEFRTIAREVGQADGSIKADAFEKLCVFINETNSPVEQAQELGISVDLYHKIVELRNHYKVNNSATTIFKKIREICGEINRAEGVFDKKPASIQLSAEKMQSFEINITLALNHIDNKKRIPMIRDICVNMTESLPIEELAKRFGIGLYDYELLETILRNHTDLSSVGRFEVIREVCDVINLPVEESVCENIDLTEGQLVEFVALENRLKVAPINDRLALFKEICVLVNGISTDESGWI